MREDHSRKNHQQENKVKQNMIKCTYIGELGLGAGPAEQLVKLLREPGWVGQEAREVHGESIGVARGLYATQNQESHLGCVRANELCLFHFRWKNKKQTQDGKTTQDVEVNGNQWCDQRRRDRHRSSGWDVRLLIFVWRMCEKSVARKGFVMGGPSKNQRTHDRVMTLAINESYGPGKKIHENVSEQTCVDVNGWACDCELQSMTLCDCVSLAESNPLANCRLLNPKMQSHKHARRGTHAHKHPCKRTTHPAIGRRRIPHPDALQSAVESLEGPADSSGDHGGGCRRG